MTRPLLPGLQEFSEKLREIWECRQLTNLGHQHAALEGRLSEVLKVQNVSLFNSGTSALMVACKGLSLEGEVITTPFTFPATIHVLAWNRITPVFCDIDPNSMNIDPERLESIVTPRTSGILGVHVFGTPCDVQRIETVANRFGLKVIYDAAHAFGVEIEKKGIGTFGDVSMFSFHATKLFHTAEGGALAFNDGRLVDRIRLLGNFGIKGEERVVLPGINGKLNELQAALGLVVLKYVSRERQKRRRLLHTYKERLRDVEGVILPENVPGVRKSYQFFAVRIDRKKFGRSRDFVYNEFRKFNIFARKYFYPLCSEYPCYSHLPSSDASKLPVANTIAGQVLCLPFYGGLSEDDVGDICSILKSFQRT